MSESVSPQSLADATCEVLQLLGPSILLDANGFLGALLDYADGESPEVRMLRLNLDDSIMAPIAEVLQSEEIMDGRKLSEAAARSAYLLQSERLVEPGVAESSMSHIAEGIRRYLGIAAIEDSDDGGNEGVDRPYGRIIVLVAVALAAVIGITAFNAMRVSVSFDANGGQGTTGSVAAFKDEEIALPASAFTRDGYAFNGWATTPSGNPIYQPEDTIVPKENLMLYATWMPQISFDGNGADSGEVKAIPLPEDGKVKLPKNGFVRNGYKFGGWSLSAEGSNPVKAKSTVVVNSATTYYATWRALAKFEANGAKEGAMDAVASAANGSLTLPECLYKNSGYLFTGWSLSTDGSDVMHAGDEITLSAPTSFYANWEAAANFAGNGATGGQTNAVAEDKEGVAILPECGFTRDGCAFLGWYEADEAFEKKPYYEVKDLRQPGNKVKLQGKPATFYACWKYDDETLEKVHVDKVERNGKEGRTLLLLIRNDSSYDMEINGQMRRVSESGEVLDSGNIFSPVVSPGETVLQAFSAKEGDEGKFDYSLLARPPRYSTKSAASRIKSEELSVEKGKVVLKLTNTSEDTVHLLYAQVYATQAGNESNGGFAYCGGEGFDAELSPGATTEVTFGADDWEAPWSSLERTYYFGGYAT